MRWVDASAIGLIEVVALGPANDHILFLHFMRSYLKKAFVGENSAFLNKRL